MNAHPDRLLAKDVLRVTGLDLNHRNAYVQQWNLTAERDLDAAIGLRLSYAGAKATKQVYGRNVKMPAPSTVAFNQNRRPFPLFRNIVQRENGGSQTYHALTTQLERKWTRGLSFMGANTWAKNLNRRRRDQRRRSGHGHRERVQPRARKGGRAVHAARLRETELVCLFGNVQVTTQALG